MSALRTLITTLMLCASLTACAAEDVPASKEGNAGSNTNKTIRKVASHNYEIHIDNAVNKNNTVDSVLVILDKFDHSGAGIVKKVFYPDAQNHILIEGLPAGKYYADIYVLGMYKKHFSSVIRTEKSNSKIIARLKLDYNDTYTPGSAYIPEENVKLFAYTK